MTVVCFCGQRIGWREFCIETENLQICFRYDVAIQFDATQSKENFRQFSMYRSTKSFNCGESIFFVHTHEPRFAMHKRMVEAFIHIYIWNLMQSINETNIYNNANNLQECVCVCDFIGDAEKLWWKRAIHWAHRNSATVSLEVNEKPLEYKCKWLFRIRQTTNSNNNEEKPYWEMTANCHGYWRAAS